MWSLQLPGGLCIVLCHYDSTQPATAPGRGQDGCPSGWRPTENGGLVKQNKCEIPRHHDRLPSDSGIRKSGKQSKKQKNFKTRHITEGCLANFTPVYGVFFFFFFFLQNLTSLILAQQQNTSVFRFEAFFICTLMLTLICTECLSIL